MEKNVKIRQSKIFHYSIMTLITIISIVSAILLAAFIMGLIPF